MIKREARFIKVTAFSKILIIQNGKTNREFYGDFHSGLSTYRPELYVKLTLTKLSIKKVLQIYRHCV